MVIDVRLIACLLLFAVTMVGQAAESRAAHLGFYSNQTTSLVGDEPHREGYALDLYREGRILFGRFYVATGIDNPSGIIQDVGYNRATGAISFRAKLSAGTEFGRETPEQGRPARDLFVFQGKLKGRAVYGKLTRLNGYDSSGRGSAVYIKLRRANVDAALPQSYQAWASDPSNAPANW